MARQIKIITQNCFLGLPMRKVRKLVHESEADVVCLQEVTSRWFVRKVDRYGKHQAVISRPERSLKIFGSRNVILSRLPVGNSGELRYEQLTKRRVNPFAGKVLWAEIKGVGMTVRIYNCYISVFGMGMEDRAGVLQDIAIHAK